MSLPGLDNFQTLLFRGKILAEDKLSGDDLVRAKYEQVTILSGHFRGGGSVIGCVRKLFLGSVYCTAADRIRAGIKSAGTMRE